MLVAVAKGAYAQSDTVSTKRRVIFVPVPSVGFSPETGWNYGGNGTLLFKLNPADTVTRTSNANVNGMYTQNKQLYIGASYNLFFWKEGYMLRGNNEFFDFNLDYYGIGPRSPNESESFFFRQLIFDNTLFKKVGGKNYIGLGYRYNRWNVHRYDPAGRLTTDNVLAFRNSVSSGVNLVYLFDNRDNIVNTFSGSLLSASLTLNARALGSTFNNPAIVIESARFFRVNSLNHILAFHALGTFNFGDVPFAEYATLGGENIKRGFYNGRFRDKQFMAAQVEYRFPIYKRLGAVAFAGVGDVASRLNSFTLATVKPSGGAGLRVMLFKDERLNFRVDYGITRESSFVYIGVGEAF